MRYLLTFLLAAALFACKTRKEMQTPAAATNLVKLATQGCRGFCPMYNLDFHTDGSVAYEGLRFTVKPGKGEFQLTADELKKLQAKLKDVNMWQYPENIESRIADAPYATITVYDGAKSHAVSGSIDRPTPIMELEMLMKDLSEAHGYPVKKGFNPDDPSLQMTAQVIVKLKPDVNAGNWVNNLGEDLKLKLVRRIATENNWLVAYSPKVHTQEEIISLLKTVDGVIDAMPPK